MRAALLAILAGCVALAGYGGRGGATASTTPSAAARPATRAKQQPPPAATARDPFVQLQALAAVATRNRGTRAAGTPGGVATEELIADRLRAAGFAVRFADVRFPFFDERGPPVVTLRGGRRLAPNRDVRTLAYSAGGDVRAAVQVVGGDRADAGCRAGDWRGFARGRIALVRRGVCPFATKARAGQRAGAAAVLVEDRAATGARGPVSGTLGAPGVRVPVVAVDAAAGAALARPRGAVRVRVDAVSEQRRARNVIGELAGTDPDRVVMAGAHLDSVPAGPGVNDDGSGVATLLALANRIAAGPRPAATLRLGFWTAEELGLVRLARVRARAERRRAAADPVLREPRHGRLVERGA